MLRMDSSRAMEGVHVYVCYQSKEEDTYQESIQNLTQNTIRESDKIASKHHTQKNQEASPYPAGYHTATRNKQGNLKHT